MFANFSFSLNEHFKVLNGFWGFHWNNLRCVAPRRIFFPFPHCQHFSEKRTKPRQTNKTIRAAKTNIDLALDCSLDLEFERQLRKSKRRQPKFIVTNLLAQKEGVNRTVKSDSHSRLISSFSILMNFFFCLNCVNLPRPFEASLYVYSHRQKAFFFDFPWKRSSDGNFNPLSEMF